MLLARVGGGVVGVFVKRALHWSGLGLDRELQQCQVDREVATATCARLKQDSSNKEVLKLGEEASSLVWVE
jgi:hypothetical protein